MTTWFSGFETGNVNDDMYPSPSNFSVISTVSGGSPRFGNFCGRLTKTGTGTSSIVMGVATSSIPYYSQVAFNVPFAMSCALRIDSLPASASEEIITIQGQQVRISSTGVLLLYGGGTTLQATGTTVLTVGHWYIFEIYATGSHQTYRVYQDGHAPGADEFSSSNSIGSSNVGFGQLFDRNGQSVTISIDDIWATDVGVSGYIGTSNVYLVSGNNDPPIYDQFSKVGAGPNAADCWNETPSNPSTACQSSASTDAKQTMAHHPLWPIGSTATINAVKTLAVGTNAQADPTSMIRLVGPPGSIVETDVPITLQFSSYWVDYWSVIPSLTDLNSSQIGIWRHAGSSTTVTNIYECYLQACYSNLVLAKPAGTIEFVIM